MIELSFARHHIPSGCFAPIVCARAGVCGRDCCFADHEREAFAGDVVKARSGANPHRVPDFDRQREEDVSHAS